MQSLESARHRTRSQRRPGLYWFGDALEVLSPEIRNLEQVADELAGACRNQNSVGPGDPFQGACELHSFADDHLLIRATAEEIADHDRTGCDACAQLKRAGAAAIKPGDRIDEGQTGANRAVKWRSDAGGDVIR